MPTTLPTRIEDVDCDFASVGLALLRFYLVVAVVLLGITMVGQRLGMYPGTSLGRAIFESAGWSAEAGERMPP